MAKGDAQFRELAVSVLFCKQCRRAQPVRAILRFELPQREYEFRCAVCELTVGSRTDDDHEFD